MSAPTPEPLCERYDLAMLDLDGVVYIGPDAVPGAAAHLAAVRDRGMRLAFVTNNAARPPEDVVDHLERLGVPARPEDVVTSAQAAARVLADRLGTGARVALLGGLGLDRALRAAGLEPVGVDDEADAVVSGYGPDVVWREVMRAAVRIRDGLWWVASNTDMSIPTPYGVAPGHGVLVETLRRFAGVDPVVAGKPAPPLLEETRARMGAHRPLMVGDRLETDIGGAHAVGVDSLLVMTGVTGLTELVSARKDLRPTYVAADLSGLLEDPPQPHPGPGGWTLGGWIVEAGAGDARVTGSGTDSDWWRVVAAHAWAWADEHDGEVPNLGRLTPPGVDGATDADR